jgi:hypothetical protein
MNRVDLNEKFIAEIRAGQLVQALCTCRMDILDLHDEIETLKIKFRGFVLLVGGIVVGLITVRVFG